MLVVDIAQVALEADEPQAIDGGEDSAEDFFAELGRHDFARQHQTMDPAARASLAAKATDLESALDGLFDKRDLDDELLDEPAGG